jgi:hypothetical protein
MAGLDACRPEFFFFFFSFQFCDIAEVQSSIRLFSQFSYILDIKVEKK